MVFIKDKTFRCKGTTLCKKRCKKVNRCNQFCKLHKYQNNQNEKLIEINQNDFCSICLNKINEKIELSCNHLFCNDCILKWVCTSSSSSACKDSNCPLCRKIIVNLQQESINFGINAKMFVYIDEYHYDTINLSDDELDEIEINNIIPRHFLTEIEWNDALKFINPEIIEKLDTWNSRCLIKVNTEEEWDYFNHFNKLYLVD